MIPNLNSTDFHSEIVHCIGFTEFSFSTTTVLKDGNGMIVEKHNNHGDRGQEIWLCFIVSNIKYF